MLKRPITSFPKPLDIELPPDCLDDEWPAILMATIGAPPTSSKDLIWLQTISAMRLEAIRDRAKREPDWAKTRQLVMIADIVLPPARHNEVLKAARLRVDQAMAAAQQAMPQAVHMLAFLSGHSLANAPDDYRNPKSRTENADRVMKNEALLRMETGTPPKVPPPERMPNIESSAADKNFFTKVSKPAKPILHFALGLAQVIDAEERRVMGELRYPAVWKAQGYGSTPIETAEGLSSRPQIDLHRFLGRPDLAHQAIKLAEAFRPAVMVLHSQGRGSNVSLIRLRRAE